MTGQWTGAVRREVLPNGLTLLVEPVPDSDAVAVVTHVRAGFFDEPDRWAGISHVLEHLYFQGTARRGVGEIARETKAAGGYLNAGTGYDYTTYYAVLPAASLPVALDLQADALRNAALDAGELARELQVIIEEAKRKRDSPGAVAHETMHAVLFDHHRVRRWRIGEEDRLAAFTRDDVAGYYRSRYVPERTIVAIAGGVEAEAALRLAREAFGGWPAAAPRLDPPVPEPWRHEVRVRTLRGDVTQAELVLGWRAMPVLEPGRAALDLAAVMLSTGRASRLQRRLRQPGVVTSISAGLMATSEVGIFSVGAELAPDRIPEALEGIGEVLEQLGRRGPSAEELDRARTQLQARWARAMESAESRAASLAHAEATDGYQWLDRAYQELMAVGADEVRDAVREWLRPDATAVVAYLPNDGGADLAADRVASALAPRARASRTRREGQTHRLALPGLDLLVRRKEGAPLVTLRLHRRRVGPEAAAEAGVGMLTVRSAVRGAGGLDAQGLAEAFERLGGPVSATAGADAFGYSATVLAGHLHPAASLLRRVMWEPALAEPTVLVERDTLMREAGQVRDDMLRFPFQLALAAAFGAQGYGLPAGGTLEALPTLGPAAARRWLDTALAGGAGVLIVVGDVDPEAAAEQLAEQFEGVAPPAAAGPWPRTSVAGGGDTNHRVEALDRQQTAIAMVFPGPSRREAGRHAAEVWAAVASGLGGRLFDALRDRRSLAYTVLAQSWQRLGAGALLTYIATSPSREAEAREQMLAELEGFRREGITADEASRAIAYLAGQAAVDRQTGSAVAADLLDAWLAGESLDEFEDPGAPYRRVTVDQVQAIAQEYLDPARRAEGVVRGREV